MKLRIFAKLGTDEKVALMCYPDHNRVIVDLLNKQFGKDWVMVDTALPCVEGVKFNDGLIYRGFEVDKERYSDAIIKIA